MLILHNHVITLCVVFLVILHGSVLLLLLGQLLRFIFSVVSFICWIFIFGWGLHLCIVTVSALWKWLKGDWKNVQNALETSGNISRSTSTFISSSVKRHLLTVMGSDLTIVVGKNEHVKEFPVHKKVLSTVSEVAATMLQSPDHKDKRVLRFPEENPETVELFIKFIYSNSWKTDLTVREALDLALFAEKYKVQVLKEKCRWYFINDVLSEETACQMYELARHLNYPNLKELCLLIFITRTDAILAQEAFTECRSVTVLCIVEQTCLNLLSGEMGLLVALAKWAKRKCERKEMTVNGQNMCRVLQPFLPYINISEIPPQEFLAELKKKVLPETEALSFIEELFPAKKKSTNLPHYINSFKRTKFCFEKIRVGVSDGRCKKRVWVTKDIVIKIKIQSGKDILLTGIQYLFHKSAQFDSKDLHLTVRDISSEEYVLRGRKCKSFVIKNVKSITNLLRTPYPLLLKANGVYELSCDYRGYVWYTNSKLAKESKFFSILDNPTCCIESFLFYSFVEDAVG